MQDLLKQSGRIFLNFTNLFYLNTVLHLENCHNITTFYNSSRKKTIGTVKTTGLIFP